MRFLHHLARSSCLFVLLLIGAHPSSAVLPTVTMPSAEEIQDTAERLYLKMEHYSAATLTPMTFELSGFSTSMTEDMVQTELADLFDVPWDEFVETKIHVHTDEALGVSGVTYRSTWQQVRDLHWSTLRKRTEGMSAAKAIDMLNSDRLLRHPVVAVTHFTVEVTLRNRVKTYRAALIWTQRQRPRLDPDSKIFTADPGLAFFLQDHIVPVVRQVQFETYEPVPMDFLDGFPARETDAPQMCIPEPRHTEQRPPLTLQSAEDHLTGNHKSSISRLASCETTADCRSTCDPQAVGPVCRDFGTIDNAGPFAGFSIHRPISQSVAPIADEQMNEGARCEFISGCAIERCFLGFCGNVSLRLGPAGFEANGAGLVRNLSLKGPLLCPAPVPQVDSFRVRFQSTINPPPGGGEASGSYTAVLRTWRPEQSPASDPHDTRQEKPVTNDGTYTFGTPIEDGHHFRVTTTARSGVENCQVTGGSGRINNGDVDDVTITCDTAEQTGEGFSIGGELGGLDAGRDLILEFTADFPGEPESHREEITVAASSSWQVNRLIPEGTPINLRVLRQPLPLPEDPPGLNIECAITQLPNEMPGNDVTTTIWCENDLLSMLELDVCARDPGICFVEDPDPINFRCSASRDTRSETVCSTSWFDGNQNGQIDPGETQTECDVTFFVRQVIECWDSSFFGGFFALSTTEPTDAGPRLAQGLSMKGAAGGGSAGIMHSTGPHVVLTAPNDGQTVFGVIQVAGFASDFEDGVSDFYFGIDGQEVFLSDFQNGLPDPNWCDSWPASLGPCEPNAFFDGKLDTRTLSNGPHKLEVVVVNNSGAAPMYSWSSTIIHVDNDSPPPSSDIRVTNNSGSTNIPPGGQLGFGSTLVGVPKDVTVRIHNDGQADLALGAVTVSGDFEILVQPPPTIEQGDSATFRVRLRATQPANPASGTVSISSNAVPTPYTFSVLGTVNAGPARIDVVDLLSGDAISSGDHVAFDGPGAIQMGDLPRAHILRIYNDGGQTLSLNGLSITGAHFWLGNPLPTSIPSGEYRDLHVHLGPPPSGGEYSARVTFSHNGSNPPSGWTIDFDAMVLEDPGCPGGEPPPCI